MSAQVIISQRFLEQYQPILKTMMGCGYQNKRPRQLLTQIEKINSCAYAISNWDKFVTGALSPELFWKALKKTPAVRHFCNYN